ncbi:helix-turn-helix domain-containing protein [Streptomyces sp. NPDC002853]
MPSPLYARCGFCGCRFRQRTGPGRRRDYCDAACRRRAQRQRDGHDVPLPPALCPWAQQIASDLQALTARLAEAEADRSSLPVLLECAALVEREVACYIAAAVHDARRSGLGWEEVSQAAGVGVQAASSRWSETKVRRLLSRRAREQGRERVGRQRPVPELELLPDGPGAAPRALLPARALGRALSYLQRRSQVSSSEAARQADLSSSYISRVLAGERTPVWPVAHMLATIFGGDPAELRILWEDAKGIRHPSRQSVTAAAGRLHAALRGMYLAAACPDLEGLCASTALPAQVAAAVLEGDLIPDWPTTALLVGRLTADPAAIRPLWEDVHYAVLVSHDIFPAAGMPPPGPADDDADDPQRPS